MNSRAQLDYYFNTVYVLSCSSYRTQKTTYYLEDPDNFSRISELFYFMTLPIHVLVFYCIIYKTPSHIKNFKYELLSFHVFTCFCDHVLNSMVVGYIFFPKFCGKPMGWLPFFNPPSPIYAYIGQISVSFLAASIVILFECRYRAVVTNRFVIRRKVTKVIYISTIFIVSMTWLIPCFSQWPEDQQAEKLRILKTLPCPAPLFFEDVVLCAISESTAPLMFYSCILFFFFIFLQIQAYACATCYYIFFSVNIKLSEKTRRLQKRIFFCLCAQVSIPTLTLFGPVFYEGYNIPKQQYDQVVNNTLYLIFGAHGAVSSICTLLVYDPYRKALFGWKRKKDSQVSNSRLSQVRTNVIKVSGY